MMVLQAKQRQQRRSLAAILVVSGAGLSAAYIPATPALRVGVATQRSDAVPCEQVNFSLGRRRDLAQSVSGRSVTSTVLRYMDTHDGDCVTASNSTEGWFGSVFRGKAFKGIKLAQPEDKNDRQAVLDEHLEFLERRYHRLHDHESMEEAADSLSGQKSIWSWLRDGGESDGPMSDRQGDALAVLGLAGVASRNALQKHAKTSPTVRKNHRKAAPAPQTLVVDAEVEPIVSEREERKLEVTKRKFNPLVLLSTLMAVNFGAMLISLVKKTAMATSQLLSKAHRGQPSNVEVLMAYATAMLLILRRVVIQSALGGGKHKEKGLFHNAAAL